MEEKVAPSSSQRQLCYGARDAFYQCLVENNESEDACKELKEKYNTSCLQSWVTYFNRKRVYEAYKKKLDEKGYQPIEMKMQFSSK